MKCLNCGDNIRWTETKGWVLGELGSGNWNEYCDDTKANEAEWDYDADGGTE